MLWVTAMAGASLVRAAALASLDPCRPVALLACCICLHASLQILLLSRHERPSMVWLPPCPLALPLSVCTEEERNSCCHFTPEATPEYFNAGVCVLTPRYVFYCRGNSCWAAVRGGCEKKTHPTFPASLTSHAACFCPLPLCPTAPGAIAPLRLLCCPADTAHPPAAAWLTLPTCPACLPAAAWLSWRA